MKRFKKLIVMFIVVMTMMTLSTLTTHAISLDYSGGSSSNDTGAGATTSGFSVSYSDTIKNVCGYRFSIVTSAGTPKSGTKVVNVYLSDKTEGTSAYSSAHRFIISSGKVANKKQLANGTKVSSTSSKQSCDYKSGDCGFYSTLPQDPSSVGSWIKNSSGSYQNLSRIYVLCGTNLASASESDYVLIEPIFRPSLAGTRTAATATELAVYGAAVSGGDGYTGSNGNLYNAGSGTLWNLMNYVNREFPNALYVSENATVYNAVTIKTSSRYTYKQIIQNGYGCSVLTVKNVIPVKKVNIAYNPNGGTTNTSLNEWGWIMMDGATYFHTINHGKSDDPYNASTFGLTRTGYQFGGWKVNSTGKILDQNTEYASTVYAQYDDASKTTANTSTVYCYLYAVWIPNTVKLAYHPNGGTASKATLNDYGFIKYNNETYFQTINHGSKADPYNASTLGLTRPGYQFAGWEVKSTGTVLNQDTEYASTVYAQHDDKSKTTANTTTVYCYLYAKWTPNKVKIKYLVNGGTVSASGYELSSTGLSIFRTSDNTNDWHTFNYGTNEDPYNASTFGLTRAGYQFAGWKVRSTGKVLDQDTEYASTVYAQYDDSSKTTANTATVTCYLDAQWTPNTVKIAYHPNGGTTTNSLNSNGFIIYNDAVYFQTINHGSSSDPYNAATLSLTRTGYTFKGWKVISTGTVLDQDTSYSSTTYAHYNDSSKTTTNTVTVSCHLYAVWEKNTYTNTIVHWKYVGTGGDNADGTFLKLGTNTFTAKYADTVTIPSNVVKTVTGHYNTGLAGSYWGTNTWSKKDIGSTFTQPAKNVSMEYLYYPKKVNVIFNKNDGSGNTANQTFTYAESGNRFGYNRDGTPKWGNNSGQFGAWDRTGYTLLGWSESPSATTATYSIYSNVSDSWINSKVPDPNASGTVNLYAVWKLYAKIVIVPIEPNAAYRENTDVISSFWLVNISGDDYTPSTGAKVVFSVYNASGQKIAGETQDFVVPNNDKNLAYFKWRVPNGYGGSNVTIKAYIDDGPYEYNHVERSYRVASFDTLTTPNTSYKDKAPDGFRVPSTTFNNGTNARWWQYSYSGGAFIKKDYAVGNTVSDVTLTTPTNPTAYTSNGKLYMKSGYGFECSYTHSMASISGYQSTSASQSVAPQYFYALFPEYNYTYGANQCRSFEAVSGRKVFVNATGMNRQHFTPIYYPDGEYKFQIVLSDCWTPAGMLTTYKTVTIQIDGNMYDDWYVGRK